MPSVFHKKHQLRTHETALIVREIDSTHCLVVLSRACSIEIVSWKSGNDAVQLDTETQDLEFMVSYSVPSLSRVD